MHKCIQYTLNNTLSIITTHFSIIGLLKIKLLEMFNKKKTGLNTKRTCMPADGNTQNDFNFEPRFTLFHQRK